MRYYGLLARPGHLRGRRAAVTAAAAAALGAVSGVLAGLVPAQAQAGAGYQPLVFHPATLAYGSVAAGQVGSQRFTLINSGRAATGRLTVTITGSGAAGFALSSNQCARVSLPPGRSCSGVIRFAPRQAGSYRAQLTARAASHGGTITATLPMSGTGTGAVARLVFTPAAYNYGNVPAGQSATRTFTLSNTGTVGSGAVTITETGHSAAFPATAGTCTGQHLAPGQHCTVTVEFRPAAAAGYTAQVDAAATPGGHATVALTGTGTAARLPSIAAGGTFTCAVTADHTLWCWGSNGWGQLGDGTTADSRVPVQVSGQATDWAAVAAGDLHTCAVKADHTLWCWGDNVWGELGDGTTTRSPVPVQVSGQASGWAAVAAGYSHTCAVKTDHTLWCWGDNGDGELGDGTTAVSPVPVQVSGQATDWAAVSAGWGYTCAVKADGTVWCWGDNGYGQLGDGTTADSPVPVQVSGQVTGWAAVSAGAIHTCAVKVDHALWCWGDNGYGELGDGTTDRSPVPVQVSGQATGWAAVTAGIYHTCAVKTDHTLWCWGDNASGQLGDGTTTLQPSPVPVQVSGQATDWAAVSAGGGYTCAVKIDGTVWCWGSNGYGQLGDGTTTVSPVPVQVSGV